MCFLRGWLKTSVTRKELRVKPPLLSIEGYQLSWLRHLFQMSPGHLTRDVFLGTCPTKEGPEVDSRQAGENMASFTLHKISS